MSLERENNWNIIKIICRDEGPGAQKKISATVPQASRGLQAPISAGFYS